MRKIDYNPLKSIFSINTVESRFFKPPMEMKIGLKSRRVREIGSKISARPRRGALMSRIERKYCLTST